MIKHYFQLLLLLLWSVQVSAQKSPLYPYWDTSGKWGYCNIDGKVMIQPQDWAQVNFFKGGRALLQSNEKYPEYGVIDTIGNYIIPTSWHWDGRWFGWDSTALNVHDDSGRFGLADSNGHLIIPMLYQPYYNGVSMSYCTADNAWQRPVLVCKKDGKIGVIDTSNHTLIPFEYDYILLNSFSYLCKCVQVQKDNKWTLIDTSNRSILNNEYDGVLSNRADSAGIIVRDKGKCAYIAYPSLHVLIPFHYKYLSGAGVFFIAIDTNDHYGIINRKGKVIIPFLYQSITSDSTHLFIEKKMQVKLAKRRGDRNAADENSSASGSYRRIYDIHTLKPLSHWVYEPEMKLNRPSCFFQEARDANDNERREPKVKVNNKYVSQYVQDSIQWIVTHHEIQLGNYILVRGHKINHSDTGYYAVVDINAQYIIPPTTFEIVSCNLNDSLLTVFQNGRYGIANYHHNMVLPFQSMQLEFGFKWQNKVFAYAKTCSQCVSIRSLLSSGDIIGNEIRDYHSLHQDGNIKKSMGVVLNSDTQVVNRFHGYRFISLGMPDGRAVSKETGSCFWVKDSVGNIGLISPTGTILYPMISFRHKYCKGVGNGFFFIRPPDGGSIGKVYDAKGEDVFPGLSVDDIRWAQSRYTKLIPNGSTLQEVPPDTNIYQIYYWTPSINGGQQHYFYMSKTGIVFSNIK